MVFSGENNAADARSFDGPQADEKKILIVDDEPDVTFTIRVILTSNGYQVDAFEDAEEALKNFRKEAYFLAFLDIKMPKMNGFDLYKKLVEIDNSLKVCFLTALGEFDDYYQRSKKEASGFPSKKTTAMRSFFGSVHFKYIVVPSLVLSVVTIAVTLDPNKWIVSDIDHFYFEIFAVILSAIVAFYCITRAYTLKEKFSLFVGVGFLTNAVIDFLHAVLSYSAAGNSDFLFYFIPQTWIAGRTFLGAMLVIAVAKYAPKVWQQAKQQIAEEKPPRIHSWNNKGNRQKDKFRYDDYNGNSNEDNNKD